MAKSKVKPPTEEETLLLAIAASPADDLPRLAYADWLRERGRESQADFVQWQLRSPYYDRPICTLKLGMRRPSGPGVSWSGPSCSSDAVKLADCISHPVWDEERYRPYPLCGRSVAVSNRGKTCGVVWRRGRIAAVWASYVSFTLPVIKALQKHPLEIFHYYGDIPGSSRVPTQDTIRGVTTGTIEYRWHKFRTTRKFQYAGEQYEFGNVRYAPEYLGSFLPAVDLCFQEALRHYLPKLRYFVSGRPTATDYTTYNQNFYPGAGCPTPTDTPPPEGSDDQPVRRLHVLGPAGGVPG